MNGAEHPRWDTQAVSNTGPKVVSQLPARVPAGGGRETEMHFRQNDLRYFAAVVEDGQLDRAAAKLLIARSVLANALEGLEARVGARLLTHTDDGIKLTAAGEEFWRKAGPAAHAELAASHVAEALAREGESSIAIGYLGLPTWLSYPRLIETFSRAHPNVQISPKELSFPWTPAAAWLAEVDVTITTQVTVDSDVWVLPILSCPRVLLVGRQHRLADHGEVTVGEVLDERFISFEPWVDPTWAGFWSLDSSRGGPPSRRSETCPTDVPEMLRLVAEGAGVTTWPAEEGVLISGAVPGVVAVPMIDAEPAIHSIVGHEDQFVTAVERLVDAGREVSAGVEGLLPAD